MEIKMNLRDTFRDKKRIVIKIGSSSLQHPETGDMDYVRLEVLVRELCDLKNQGKDVTLVSSGAIAQGKKRSAFLRKIWSATQSPSNRHARRWDRRGL